MMEYGQFCPIAKASEIIGEKWTILIIREVLMGSRRFNDLQRGLGTISPTLLSRRLSDLELHGLLLKKKMQGQKGHEYFPTESCRELLPILLTLGDWGMRWARSNLSAKDYDVALLMLYLQRSIVPEKLPDTQFIVQFTFTDLPEKKNWWLVISDGEVDTCDKNPGKDVDVYFSTSVKTMVEIWTGTNTYRKALSLNQFSAIGPKALTNNISAWMNNSIFCELPSALEI